ncbi:hypothetical protein GCM10023196_035430 [Actinoallomurus vinaceus]|uniref:Hydrolase n=1 Tax=Actinoallomurus vinaceus TaxID=1080074 RepID=A0ABP8UC40_9ACTN
MLTGVDVSSYQGAYDWGKAKRNRVAFGIVKATEGLTIRDSQFARNWRELKRVGLVRGAYHFGHPKNDPVAEAEFFYSVIGPVLEDGDLVVLDHEASDGQSPGRCSSWAQAFTAHLELRGLAPIVYTFLSFAEEGRCAGLGGRPLWIADPSRPAGQPRVPGPWTSWVMHQYSETGGIDRDVFNGDAAAWRALGQIAQQEDDMADAVSLGVGAGQEVPAKGVLQVTWAKEFSDAHAHHGDNGLSVIVADKLWGYFTTTIDVTGLKPGDTYDVEFARVSRPAKADDAWSYKDDGGGSRCTFDRPRAVHSYQFALDGDTRGRVWIHNPNDYPITVTGGAFKAALLKY